MAAEIIDQALMQNQLAGDPQSILERFFHSMGLMQGELSPWYRMAFGFGVVAAAVWALRPGFAFSESGSAKPFRFFAPEDPESTLVPWWALPLLAGVFSGVFV